MSPIKPMNLGDIFERLFALIARTWRRNLIIVSLVLVVPTIVLVVGINAFFSAIAGIAEEGDVGGGLIPRELITVLGSLLWFFFALVLFLAGATAATLGVTIVGCSEISDQRITWQEALRTSFGVRLLRLFGLYILQGFAIATLLLIPYVLLIVAIASESLAIGLFAAVLLILSIVCVIFVGTRWALTVPAIGWEEAPIIEAFRRSWRLVGGNWWRAFGILLLMGLIINVAVSFVTTPLYLIVLWDFFLLYLESFAAGFEEPDPSAVMRIFKSFGLGIGLMTGLSTTLQLLVAPLYTAILYFDLRARKGEFRRAAPDALESSSPS